MNIRIIYYSFVLSFASSSSMTLRNLFECGIGSSTPKKQELQRCDSSIQFSSNVMHISNRFLKHFTTAYDDHLFFAFFNLSSFFQTLALDVLEFVYKICLAIEAGDSSKANDLYLRLAIGNDPWPLGVTAVC